MESKTHQQKSANQEHGKAQMTVAKARNVCSGTARRDTGAPRWRKSELRWVLEFDNRLGASEATAVDVLVS